MILHRITLRNFRRFNREFEAEFDPEINLITGPNESGKTSLVLAVPFALFTPIRSQSALREVYPYGNPSLKPWIRLEVTLDGQRYRITKDFGRGMSRVEVQDSSGTWRSLLEGPEADHWLAEHFEAELSQRLRGFPTQWGLAHALWLVQFPGIPTAPALRPAVLQQQQQPVSPLLQELLDRLARDLNAEVTEEKRLPKAGGRLKDLLEEVASLEAQLSKAKERLAEIQHAQEELEQIEHELQERREALARVEEQLERDRELVEQAKEIQQELKTLRLKRESAEKELRGITEKLRQARRLWEEYQEIQQTARKLSAAHLQLDQQLQHLEARRQTLRQGKQEAEKEYQQLQDKQAELQEFQRIHDLRKQLQSLEKRYQQAKRREERLKELKRLSRGLASQKLTQWLQEYRKARDKEQRARAQLEGLALRVVLQAQQELAPKINDQTVRLAPGQLLDTEARPGFTLEVPGVLRLSLEASGEQVRRLHQQAEEAQRRQREILRQAGVGSLEELERLSQQVLAAEQEIQRLREEGLEDPEELLGEIQRLKLQLEQIPEHLPSPEEVQVALRETRKALKEAKARLGEAQSRLEEAEAAYEKARQEQEALKERRIQAQTRQDALWQQLQDLLAEVLATAPAQPAEVERFLNALDAQRQEAEKQVEGLRKREQTLEAQLPDESVLRRFEEHQKRREEIQREIEELRDRFREAETRLELFRRQNPDREYQHIQGRLEARRRELRAMQRRVEAQLLLRDLASTLLEQRTRALDRYLAREVEALLERITGVPRPVMLQEGRWVVGFPNESAEAQGVPEQVLSSGTQEQFALALRLAYGLALARVAGRQMVVLDDALVFSDRRRFAHILGLLEGLRDRLQFLILTSHPERYAPLRARRIDLGASGSAAAHDL